MRETLTDRELLEQWKERFSVEKHRADEAERELALLKKDLRNSRKSLSKALQLKTYELKATRDKLKKYKAYVLALTGRDAPPKAHD